MGLKQNINSLLCVLCLTSVQCFYTVQEFPKYNAPLTQVAVDHSSGNVFVGGNNIFLKLDDDISVIQTVNIGLVLDNKECPPYPETCTYYRTPTDNSVRVLELNQEKGYILLCGSAWQGLCTCHEIGNIQANKTLSRNKATNFIGGNIRTVAMFGGPSRYSGNNKLLYVAMGTPLDDRHKDFIPALISTRNISYSSQPWSMKYLYDDGNMHTYIDMDSNVRGLFRSYYIYGFEYETYVYFISVQMQDPNGYESAGKNKYLTKIIQVCKDDMAYASYTELPLECIHKGIVYDLAADAHTVYTEFGLKWEKTLFVTFGKNNTFSPDADPTEGSVMCYYSMVDILDRFGKLQSDCFDSGEGYRPLWVYGKKIQCLIKTSVLKDDEPFCGSNDNIGIQDSTPGHVLSQTATTHLESKILTSVVAVNHKQGNQNITIAIMGTHDGHIVKTKVAGFNKEMTPYSVYDISKDRKVKVQSDMELGKSGKNVYLLADNKVIKYPLDSCEVHSTCETCVGSGDPLGCGWCVDKCTTQAECIKPTESNGGLSNWSSSKCPPVITKVTPITGPLEGNTNITLTGRNFGSANTQEVSISDIICKVTSLSQTSLVCATSRIEIEEGGRFPVKIKVTDYSQPNGINYDIDGEFLSSDVTFTYRDPEVTSFAPTLGPVSGGTLITITGNTLNIGGRRSVTVDRLNCEIERFNATQIHCFTNRLTPLKRDSAVVDPRSVLVEVFIDDWKYILKEKFNYRQDSTIQQVVPSRTIASGGLNLTVTGTNLDIIKEPRIGVTINNKHSRTKICQAEPNGLTMYCPSPNITDLISKAVDPFQALEGRMWFKMDGIKELGPGLATDQNWMNMRYFPDPKFYKFGQVKQLTTDDTLLEIKGEHLNRGVQKTDVTVKLGGGGTCTVASLKTTVITCIIEGLEPQSDSDRHLVLVTVGGVENEIGYMVYTKKVDVGAVSTIVLVVALVITISGIIALVVILWKKKIGPFKKKKDEYMARYRQGTEVPNDTPDGQRMFDLQNRDNAYTEQRLSDNMAGSSANPLDIIGDDTLLVLRDKNLLVEREWLQYNEILGRGHFGCVYKGFITYPNSKGDTMVAVKTLHQNNPREIDIQSFIEEALRMKDFHHDNVLTLTGICFGMDDMPLVILPYMKHGDLLSYIRNENNNPTIKDLIMFGIDISSGMEYLASLKFVHRDLAARNCMLDEGFRVKVADFGLSRDIYERDYYSSDNKKNKLPVKWMAPESLEKGNYNSKSDVWSFGVVLWELMTRGVNPYPEVDNWDVLRYIKAGRRMPQPPYCPDSLYGMMMKCWAFNPDERPRFTDLVIEIQRMIEELEHQMKQGQHRTNIQSTYVNVDTCTDYHYGDHTIVGQEPSSPVRTPSSAAPSDADSLPSPSDVTVSVA